MICAVTGANGFVGSHMVDLLLEKGHEVHAIVREKSNTKWLDGKDVQIHRCGLGDVAQLAAVFAPCHYIFHIAGVVKALNLDGFLRGNVQTTERVFEAAKYATDLRRIVVVSSMAATGFAEIGSEVDEQSPLQPIEPYGISKVEQEKVAYLHKGTIPYTIVRPPGIYGPRDTEILAFFKAINSGFSVLMGFKDKEMSLIHIHDLVNGMYLAASSEKSLDQIYFLGSLEKYNWKQLGQVASKAMSKRVMTIKIPHFVIYLIGFIGQILESRFKMDVALNKDRAFRITRPSWYCSSQKAVDDFKFTQDTSIENGFSETIRWYQENKWL